MFRLSGALATIIFLLSPAAAVDTQDFSFLVKQEIIAFQCPGHDLDDPFKIDAAIKAEGQRLGWSADQTQAETLARREHQLEQLTSDPEKFCGTADELKEASQSRLRRLLAAQ